MPKSSKSFPILISTSCQYESVASPHDQCTMTPQTQTQELGSQTAEPLPNLKNTYIVPKLIVHDYP